MTKITQMNAWTAARGRALWDLCTGFVLEQDIRCLESIWQSDRIPVEDAHLLIERIVRLTGLAPREVEEGDGEV